MGDASVAPGAIHLDNRGVPKRRRRLQRALPGEPPEEAPPGARREGAEGAGAFGGFIGPRTLVGLVRNTAPYLFDGSAPAFTTPPAAAEGARIDERARGPLGWWSVLRHADDVVACERPTPAQVTGYFALCVAAHFASVATFVPTDVDSKIRGHLWFSRPPADELARMRELALGLATWDVSSISARIVVVDPEGPVSGHDGERLSVLSAGLLAHLALGDLAGARQLDEAIEAELEREARAFERVARTPGRERDLLVLAATLTHNAGDVDQGLSATGGGNVVAGPRERFGRLAHERPARFGGAFTRAAALYRELMAAEGHRHYPLRETRLLRQDPALLLPVGPFLEEWGVTLATYPRWTNAERAEVLAALARGARKVRGQEGYYRALAGFERAHPRGLTSPDLMAHLPSGVRRDLEDTDLRKRIAVRQASFESALFKRARAVLAATPRG